MFKSEYGLLLHIAASRTEGILQGELGRVAGQDKRSVPKRTDSLHAKGYIVKETVPFKGYRSSRLTLRRFATPYQVTNAARQTAAASERRERNVEDLIQDVVGVLANRSLVEVEQLGKMVDMSTEASQKALMKILRPLIKSGHLKKVKAAIGASAHTGEPKVCLQQLRAIDPADLSPYNDGPFPLNRTINDVLEDQDAQYPEDAAIRDDDEMMAQWNPDRNIANVIHQAVTSAGAAGLSNNEARALITGMNLRRPIESQLVRLSFAGLLSQPPHLQHLAIVRANRGGGGQPDYVHLSRQGVDRAIRAGELKRSSVRGAAELSKSSTGSAKAGSPAELDSFGFPVVHSDGLLSGGASLKQIVEEQGAVDILGEAASQPETPCRPVSRSTRRSTIRSAPQPESPVPSVAETNDEDFSIRKPIRKNKGSRRKEDIPIGRPRKFLRGTEKFWQYHFWQARVEAEGFGTSKAGTMSHPIGKALFDSRPAQFDAVLVRAKEAGLPLPKSRDDISEAWIAQTVEVLDRRSPGIYISPPGMHISRVLQTSRFAIIKSTRLASLDLRAQPKIYRYRFLASSVAHSFQHLRYYPPPQRPRRNRKVIPKKFDVEYPPDLLEAFGKLPKAGIFYESIGQATTPRTPEVSTPKLTAAKYRELMDETDDDSEIERHRTPPPVVQQAVEQGVSSPTTESDMQSPVHPLARRKGGRRASNSVEPEPVRGSSPLANTRPARQRKVTQKAAESTRQKRHQYDQPSPASTGANSDAASVAGPVSPSAVHDVVAARDEQTSPRNGFQSKDARPTITRQESVDLSISNGPRNHTNSRVLDYVHSHGSNPEVHKERPTSQAASIHSSPSRTAAASWNQKPFSEVPPVREDASLDEPQAAQQPSKRKPSEAFASDSDQSPRKVAKRSTQSQASLSRTGILDLLKLTDGVGTGNHSVVRRCFGPFWRAEGQSGLPNLTTVKHAIQGLVASGQLKQHTFTFRSQDGMIVSRSMLYPLQMQLTDPKLENLKHCLIEAGLVDYIPPEWKERLTVNKELLSPPVSLSPDPEHVDNPDDVEQRQPHATRPRRRPARVQSFTSEEADLSEDAVSTRSVSSSGSAAFNDSPSLGFLSLNVPRLGSLPQVQQHNDTLQKAVPTFKGPDKPKTPRKARTPRAPRAKAENLQKVLWKTKKVPESLEALLEEQYAHNPKLRPTAALDTEESLVHAVNVVSKWEHRLVDKLVETKAPWTFINHAATSKSITPNEVDGWMLVLVSDNGEVNEEEHTNYDSWLPFVQALEKSRLEPGLGSNLSATPSKGRITRQATGSIQNKRRWNFDDAELDEPKKRARQDDDVFEDTPRSKRSYVRKPKAEAAENANVVLLSKVESDDIFRTVVSVIVVSTLAGGPERNINWNIVDKLWPDLLRSALKARWKAIEQVYADEVSSLVSNFRTEYAKAVQNGLVPMVDFSDHAKSAWTDILNWALAALPNFIQDRVLPSSREDLADQYHLTYAPTDGIRQLLVPNANLRSSEREEYVSSLVFGAALSAEIPSNTLTTLARSIILSCLLTESFNAIEHTRTQKLLLSLTNDRNTCEEATATALTDLTSDRLITKTNTNHRRNTPLLEKGARAYTLTDKFSDLLDSQRIVNHSLLKEATNYKLSTLDTAFSQGESVAIIGDNPISNGQMLALIDLLDAGMIRVVPGAGSMKSRYGVGWEKIGYQTRQVDQKDLAFDVVVEAAGGYVFGELGRDDVEAPKKGMRGEWPMWVDVRGEVLEEVWAKVVAAVVGIVHLRPGVSCGEIKEMLGGVVWVWEVESVLRWAGSGGYVQRTSGGTGWQTTSTWWWCVAGAGGDDASD